MTETVTDEAPTGPLLEVRDLRVSLRTRFERRTEALHGVDLELCDGETLAVVGESGSGKTLLGESLTRLHRAARYRGNVRLRGHSGNLIRRGEWRLSRVRGRRIGYLFGNPPESLHGPVTVRQQLKEVLNFHRPEVKNEDEEIVYWLTKVGLPEPEATMHAMPGDLELIFRRRVAVALALCTFPEILVADEPSGGLDPTSEEEILKLIHGLRAGMGIAMLVTTRDFRVAYKLADRVAVLESGRIVETAALADLLDAPLADATRRLLANTPGVGDGGAAR